MLITIELDTDKSHFSIIREEEVEEPQYKIEKIRETVDLLLDMFANGESISPS